MRAVPVRVESKACQGAEFTILNENAPSRLNEMQRMWGAALLDVYPGNALFTRIAGWKLLCELGWNARQWHRTVVRAVMLEERARLSGWHTLTAAMELAASTPGGWTHKVRRLREEFGIPEARPPMAAALSKGSAKYRARLYRRTAVEPAVHGSTEEELRSSRADPRNALYSALHPGRGPVAGCLQGHGWGVHTVGDYKRWALLRVVLRFEGGCSVCRTADPTAEHFLGAHAAQRVHEGIPQTPLGPLWLLRTDLPWGTLRRNIRLVGQLVHGRGDWGWLRGPAAPGRDEEAAAESREESGTDGGPADAEDQAQDG